MEQRPPLATEQTAYTVRIGRPSDASTLRNLPHRFDQTLLLTTASDEVVAAIGTRQMETSRGVATVIGPLAVCEAPSPSVGRILLHRAIHSAFQNPRVSAVLATFPPPPQPQFGKRISSSCQASPYFLRAAGDQPRAAGDQPRALAAAEEPAAELLGTAAESLGTAAADLCGRLDCAARERNLRLPSEHRTVGLMSLGFTSSMLVQAVRAVMHCGCELPSTMLFDFPTLEAAEAHLLARPPALGSTAVSEQRQSELQLGVDGVSCLAPAHSTSHRALWLSLAAAQNAISLVPPERWTEGEWYCTPPGAPGKMYVRQAGFLPTASVAEFSHEMFSISTSESSSMSPAQRLLLEHATEAAVCSVSCAVSDLHGAAIGVCVGSCHHDWERLNLVLGARSSAYRTVGEATSALAGRVSYQLGLTGPSMVVDTACSSSLVAGWLAASWLQLRTCESVLIMAENLLLDPRVTVQYCQAQMLSADCMCKTFDDGANGYVRAESCAGVMLSVNRANVEWVAAAVNQDGVSATLTSPNGLSQQAVIMSAYCSTDIRQCSTVEAHGTGTRLGDPIEVSALLAVMQAPSLTTGALKSQLGHLEAAAGLAGLIKVLTTLQGSTNLPNLHFCKANSHFSDDVSKILFCSEVAAQKVSKDTQQLHSLSSFGMSGTNAHAVLTGGDSADSTSASCFKIRFKRESFRWYSNCEQQRSVHRSEESDSAYSILGQEAEIPKSQGIRQWQQHWPNDTMSFMRNHRVGTVPLVPGTAYLVLASCAAQKMKDGARLAAASFESFLFLDCEYTRAHVRVTLDSARRIELESLDSTQSWASHFSISAEDPTPATDAPSGDLVTSPAQFELRMGDAELYATIGNKYRADFQCVSSVWISEDAITAKLVFETPAQGKGLATLRCISCLDGSVQPSVLAYPNGVAGLPFYYEQVSHFSLFQSALSEETFWSTSCSAETHVADESAKIVSVSRGTQCGFLDIGYLTGDRVKRRMYHTVWQSEQQLTEDASCASTIYIKHPLETDESAAPRARTKGKTLELSSVHVAEKMLMQQPLPDRVVYHTPQREPFETLKNHAQVFDTVGHLIRLLPPNVTLWVVTSETMGPCTTQWLYGGLLAFIRSLRVEKHSLDCCCVDQDAEAFERLLPDQIPSELVAVGDKWCVPRLNAYPRTTFGSLFSSQFSGNKTYLLSGGTGALGLYFAVFMAQCHATHLTLLSRSGRNPLSTVQECGGGCELKSITCDITSHTSVALAVSSARSSSPQVDGIVHMAGVGLQGSLKDMSFDQLHQVMSPKVFGAYNLELETSASNLSTFMMFSSASAVFGLQGSAGYAAANGCLDAFVQYRRAAGVPALSIQWGAWTEIGMATDLGLEITGYVAGGVSNVLGQWAAEAAMLSSPLYSCVMVADMAWPQFLKLFDSVPLLLSAFDTQQRDAGASQETQKDKIDYTPFVAEVMEMRGVSDQQTAIASLMVQKVREAAGITVGVHDALMESGVDSLAATDLRNLVQQELGSAFRLTSTIMLDYPTCAVFAEYLQRVLKPPSIPDKIKAKLPVNAAGSQPVTVAAMSSYSPGGCDTTSKFWLQMTTAHDVIQPIPLDRFDVDAMDGTTRELPVKAMHLVDNVEVFDPAHFRISASEAASLDPHQRLLLEVGYRAFAAADETKHSLMGSDTGVFVGVMLDSDWLLARHQWDKAEMPLLAYSALSGETGAGGACLCGRVSFVLGLRGPCFAVSTACSASLAALDQASQNVQLGRCTKALVAGVNLVLHPAVFYLYAAAKVLASDSACKTFDTSADGLGRSESCGAVVLSSGKSTITLLGTSVNQDGRSASFAAPSGVSQALLMQTAESQAADYIRQHSETHGTGTALGDPLETGAIRQVHQASDGVTQFPLTLGASKSRLGHGEGSAGIMGLLKTMLTLREQNSGLNLHFKECNPKLDLEDFEVLLPTQMEAQSVAADANSVSDLAFGVSSFGMTGVNAHALVAPSSPGFSAQLSESHAIVYNSVSFKWWDSEAVDAVGLLGILTQDAPGSCVWQRTWPLATQSYVAEHRAGRTSVVSASVLLQLAQTALPECKYSADYLALLMLDDKAPKVEVTVAANLVLIKHCTAAGTWSKLAEIGASSSLSVPTDKTTHSEEAVQVSQQQCVTISSESFYAACGNNHRGDFRGVRCVCFPLNQDGALPVANIVLNDVCAAIGNLAMQECKQLRAAALLDGCIQAQCLADLQHSGAPHVMLPTNVTWPEYGANHSLWTQLAPNEQIRIHNISSTTEYGVCHMQARMRVLQVGSLEEEAVLKHTYHTAWVPSEASPITATTSNVIWAPVTTESALLRSSSQRALHLTGLEELCKLADLTDIQTLLVQPNHASCAHGLAGAILALLQRLAAASTVARVYLLTSDSLGDGCLVGLSKVVNIEMPEKLKCSCVHVTPASVQQAVNLISSVALDSVLSHSSDFRYRGNQLEIAQLQRGLASGKRDLDVSGGCMLSGGTGAVGMFVSSWLSSCGCSQLVLLSRGGVIADGAHGAWSSVSDSASSSRVQIEQCDIAQPLAVQIAISASRNTQHIFHLAGALKDAVLANQTQTALQYVWSPKAYAAQSLHKVAAEENRGVQSLMLFSSVAALLGGQGQANYAAANSYLDALANQNEARHLTVVSVQWGVWASAGMAVRSGAVKHLEKLGYGSISQEVGTRMLELALQRASSAVVGMVPLDWSVYLDSIGPVTPVFLTVFDGARPVSEEAIHDVGGAVSVLSDLPHGQLISALEEMVLRHVAAVSIDTVSREDSLVDAGVDSLAATELQSTLQQELGSAIKLKSTLVTNYPTVAALAEFVAGELAQRSTVTTAIQSPIQFTKTESIGVVGMSCWAAGSSRRTSQLWETLLCGASCITSTPPARWVQSCAAVGAPDAVLTGGFISELQPSRVWLQPKVEADMHVLVAQEVIMEGLCDAGLSSTLISERASSVGLFTAMSSSDFTHPTAAYEISRSVASALRVDGPHMNFEAACSSGYLAVSHAIESLERGESSIAAAGGVCLMLKPDYCVNTLEQSILSNSGRMRPFDATADGMVCGEAAAAVVLQPTAASKASVPMFRAHSCHRNSTLSPSGFADGGLMQAAAADALEKADRKAHMVAIAHLHAMGNPASDTAELVGVVHTLTNGRNSADPFTLVSHKANIGHTVSASGIIAVIVTSVSLLRQMVPPVINVVAFNRKLKKVKHFILPLNGPLQLSASEPVGSISGTSASGHNQHFVMQCHSGGRKDSMLSTQLNLRCDEAVEDQ